MRGKFLRVTMCNLIVCAFQNWKISLAQSFGGDNFKKTDFTVCAGGCNSTSIFSQFFVLWSKKLKSWTVFLAACTVHPHASWPGLAPKTPERTGSRWAEGPATSLLALLKSAALSHYYRGSSVCQLALATSVGKRCNPPLLGTCSIWQVLPEISWRQDASPKDLLPENWFSNNSDTPFGGTFKLFNTTFKQINLRREPLGSDGNER